MQSEAPAPVYKRIVLKLSGEALRERGARENISPQIVREIAERIKEVQALGVQTSVVIGGGNIWRGLSASHRGMDRTTADYMGMLATVINGLALQSALVQLGVQTRVQTAIEMKNVAEPFILGRAIRHLELGRVVIFVAGTGNPYFSTDTTAALRASEIRADVILKATKVDGVYDRDPNERSQREALRSHHLFRSADQAPPGHGLDRVQPLHGQQNPDRRFRHEPAEQLYRHRARQEGRDDRVGVRIS